MSKMTQRLDKPFTCPFGTTLGTCPFGTLQLGSIVVKTLELDYGMRRGHEERDSRG